MRERIVERKWGSRLVGRRVAGSLAVVRCRRAVAGRSSRIWGLCCQGNGFSLGPEITRVAAMEDLIMVDLCPDVKGEELPSWDAQNSPGNEMGWQGAGLFPWASESLQRF